MLLRISLGLDRLSGDSLKGYFEESLWVWIDFRVILNRVLSRISLGLDRLSGDSLKGAFKNQFGSGSTFGWFFEGCFQESVWVWIDFRVIQQKGSFKNQFGSGSVFA